VRIAVWLSIPLFVAALYWWNRDREFLSEAKVIRFRKDGLL
jgi:hypothetical protein